MKNKLAGSAIAIFLFFSNSSQLFGQYPVSPNLRDENGLRIGHWTIWYDSTWKEVHHIDSVIYYRLIRFEAGKPAGKVRDFYKTGFKQWDGFLLSINPDVMEGESNFYHENGKLKSREYNVHGLLEGPSTEYNVDGNLIVRGQNGGGKSQGKWTYFYATGEIEIELEMKDSQWHGAMRNYYRDGKIKGRGLYANHLRQGAWEFFSENGNRSQLTHYKDGKLTGVYEVYYEDGSLKEKGMYDSDLATGLWSAYFPDKKPEYKGHYANGNKDGDWIYYYPNGKVKNKGRMKDGSNEGAWEYFFDTGELSNQGTFSAGHYDGDWTAFFSNGKTSERSHYRMDTLNGYYISYQENGNKKSEGRKMAGQEEGPWKYYHEDGSLKTEGTFRQGAREGVWKYYAAEGHLEDIETYQAGKLHGDAISYYPDAREKLKTTYVDGKAEGPVAGYYGNGVKQVEGTYLHQAKNGRWVWYWENRNPQTQSMYEMDTLQGLSVDYYPNGTRKSEIEYKDGLRNGSSSWYYANGKLTETGVYQNGLAYGHWARLDSVTQKKITEGNMVNNKFDGIWLTYDTEGRVTKKEYYINGFNETRDNIRDSIQQLLDREDFDKAFQAADWMDKVTRRDYARPEERTLPIQTRAKIYSSMRDYKGALPLNLQYIRLVKKYEGEGSENYKTAVHNLASNYHGLKQFDKALLYYDDAIRLAKPEGLVKYYWSSVNNKAYCLYDGGKPEEAARLFEDELAKSAALYGPDSSAGWYLRHEAAEYYYDRPDDYDRSYVLFKDLLDDILAAHQPDNRFAYDCYIRLAFIIDLDRRQGQASIPFYREGIAYAERNNLTPLPEYPELLTDLYYVYQGNFETDSVSAKGYEEIVQKLLALPAYNNYTQSRIWLTIGNYYNDQKKYGEALSYFLKSKDALDKAGRAKSTRYADILKNIAIAQLNADKREAPQAEAYFQQAASLRKELSGEDSKQYHEMLLALSTFYTSAGKRNQTMALLHELIPMLQAAKDSVNLANANFYLGRAYDTKGQYREAIINYEKAKDFYVPRENEYPNWAYNTEGYIADCYKYLNDYQHAKAYAERAAAIAERHFGTGSRMHLFGLVTLADIYSYNGVYSEALKLYTQVAAGFEKMNGRSDNEHLFNEYKITKTLAAMSEYKKAVELGESQRDWIGKTLGKVNDRYLDQLSVLGNTYNDMLQFDLAGKRKAEALDVAGDLYGKSHTTYAFYLLDLGKFNRKMNRLEEAEVILTEAVALIRASDFAGTSLGTAYLIALAQVKNDRDKNKEAEALFIEAFNTTRPDSLNSLTQYVEAGEELAAFYSKVGRYGDSEKVILRITNFIGLNYGKNYYYARVRKPLVLTYYGMLRYDEAEKEGGALLEIAEEEGGSEHWLSVGLHNDLGLVAQAQNQFEKAREQYQFCIDALLRNPAPSAIEQYNLGVYYANLATIELCLGQDSRAGEHLATSDRIQLKAGEEISHKASIGQQSKWASYYRATGQFEKAESAWTSISLSLLKYTDENFFFMSDEEKAQFWKDVSGYFRTFHSFAIQRVKQNPAIIGQMYDIQLATKAILLNASNKIKKRILTSGDSAMVNTYYRWTHQREQLAKLYTLSGIEAKNKQRRIDSLKTSINVLEKEMNITAEDMMQDKGGSRTTWKQVQALLGPNEAAVEMVRFRYYDRYVRDSVIYAALVLTAETRISPQLVLMPDGKKMEGRGLRFYKNAITTQLKDTVSYGNFWAPIGQAVQGKSRIYLSLDGVYNQINLNTLLAPDGKYLVADKNLTILSNTKDLTAIKGRRARRLSFSSAALFGFPTFFLGKDKTKDLPPAQERDFSDTDQTGIAPLAGTQQEIQKVQNILQQHMLTTVSYTDEHATEAALKKVDHPRVLHIATHGFFVDEKNTYEQLLTGGDQNPLLRSGLLLTGASNFLQNRVRLDEENGILTAYEAANLDLDNTDLVVLSACETGRGEVQNGEGVYGLQRAFQTAGVQSIIMSLWKVDDTATQQLMTSFYTNWMGGMTKAEALKAAQLILAKQYPHPYYWGAFVMLEN